MSRQYKKVPMDSSEATRSISLAISASTNVAPRSAEVLSRLISVPLGKLLDDFASLAENPRTRFQQFTRDVQDRWQRLPPAQKDALEHEFHALLEQPDFVVDSLLAFFRRNRHWLARKVQRDPAALAYYTALSNAGRDYPLLVTLLLIGEVMSGTSRLFTYMMTLKPYRAASRRRSFEPRAAAMLEMIADLAEGPYKDYLNVLVDAQQISAPGTKLSHGRTLGVVFRFLERRCPDAAFLIDDTLHIRNGVKHLSYDIDVTHKVVTVYARPQTSSSRVQEARRFTADDLRSKLIALGNTSMQALPLAAMLCIYEEMCGCLAAIRGIGVKHFVGLESEEQISLLGMTNTVQAIKGSGWRPPEATSDTRSGLVHPAQERPQQP